MPKVVRNCELWRETLLIGSSDEFKECFRKLVRETVAEEIEPLRDVLLKPTGDALAHPVSELLDMTQVARILSEYVSNDRTRRRAALMVRCQPGCYGRDRQLPEWYSYVRPHYDVLEPETHP